MVTVVGAPTTVATPAAAITVTFCVPVTDCGVVALFEAVQVSCSVPAEPAV